MAMTSSLNNFNSILDPVLAHQTNERNSMYEQESTLVSVQPEVTIALLPSGDLIEDFLDTLGVSFESWCAEMTGGWMFNYIDALKLIGVRTVVFCFSARVSETVRLTHAATGVTMCLLPAPKSYRAYRAIQRQALDIYARSVKGKFSDVHDSNTTDHSLKFRDIHDANTSPHSLLVALKNISKSLGAYLSTPLGLLARELQREGCAAILCQEYEYARFDACVFLGQLMRLPVFATFQGGDRSQSFLEYPLRWLAFRACAGLIISTQSEGQRLHAFYGVPDTKIARIFTPMEVETWRATDRAEARVAIGIPLEARVVVWHGRVEIDYKGLDILLDAWDQICRDRPEKDLRLLLVGTGSDAEKLRQCIATMQLRGVMWIDEFVRDRAVIQRYLSAADVYTLSSRREGFPIAPLEAMACSLPVVAADAPGVPDILEGCEASGGLVVPRGNATALASALGRVLDDEAWGRELGKRARCRVEKYFSPEVSGKQLRDFLFSQKIPMHES